MKTKLFIDFDDTLFDTKSFKKDLFMFLEGLGFSEEEVKTTYDKVRDQNIGYKGVKAHLQELEKIRDIDHADTTFKLLNFMRDLRKYLFPEAVTFLESIDRDKYEVKLLTVGDRHFQEMKAQGSGIEEIIGKDNCEYTEVGKDERLKELLDADEGCVLIEDKISTKEKVEAIPGVKVHLAEAGNLLELGHENGIIVDEVKQEGDSPVVSRV